MSSLSEADSDWLVADPGDDTEQSEKLIPESCGIWPWLMGLDSGWVGFGLLSGSCLDVRLCIKSQPKSTFTG